MAVVTIRQLLDSGVHFGHQTRRWNPKVKRFILTERSGIHIIDDSLGGSDTMQTSAALAAAISSRGFDLVIAGNESTDGRTAAIPARRRGGDSPSPDRSRPAPAAPRRGR